jgi:hypothetical protein
MRLALCLVVFLMLGGIAFAQKFDVTTVTDQLTTGKRGNETGTGGSFGASKTDGTEFAAYSGSDATGTPIQYCNAYAGASSGDGANGESPTQDVATIKQPDYNTPFSSLTQPITVPANTRPTASSTTSVLTISDDGGQNTLIIGDETSSNYYAQVDFYAIDRSANPTEYEAAYLAIRSCRNGAALTGGGYVIDREPCYALWYDYNLKQVKAVRYQAGTSTAAISGRTGVAQQYGSTVTAVTTAWHTFRIEAINSAITFKLDGTTIASVTDTSVATGRIALGYRAGGSGPPGANESAAVFDNFRAGPTTTPSSAVGDWQLFN